MRTVTPGRCIRWGFVGVAVVDALVAAGLALTSSTAIAPRVLALQVAYSIGHVVFSGFVVAVLADVGDRILPPRILIRAAATWLVAASLAVVVFADDFAVFPPHIRWLLLAAASLPFAALVAIAPLVSRHRLLGGALVVFAVALAVANSFVLDRSYAGIHLAATLGAGVLAGTGMMRLAKERLGAELHVGWAIAALAAASSVVVWPSNAVLIALCRQPTSSLLQFLTQTHDFASTPASRTIPAGQEEWFRDRSSVAPIPPTRPALHPQPIVIFVTVDALRADIVADPAQPATKNLRALAAAAADFTQARSPASATSPSIGALFRGKYYSSLYWTPANTRGGKLKYFLAHEPSPRWTDLLAEVGVRRVMVRRQGGFGPESGLIGGMDEYTRPLIWADGIVRSIGSILGTAGDGPLLIYAHMMDPHAPYTSRGKFADKWEGYLAEVAFVDEQLGVLADVIQRQGLEDRTFLIVTSDHGEAFGEHGSGHHATTVYEELVRVPLFIRGPGVVPRVLHEPVSLIDLGPTVLDLFGAATPGHFMGQSLVPLARGDDVELTRPLVLDTGRRKQALVGRDGMKIIRDLRHHTYELYDLTADPAELVNLADEQPARAEERLGALAAFFDVHELRREGYVIPYRD